MLKKQKENTQKIRKCSKLLERPFFMPSFFNHRTTLSLLFTIMPRGTRHGPAPGVSAWNQNSSYHNTSFYSYLFFFNLFIYFIYLFLAALALPCCVHAFSSCGQQGLLFVAVHGLLIAVASLVAEHGVQARGSPQLWLAGSRAQAQQLWRMGFVALRRVGTSRTRA